MKAKKVFENIEFKRGRDIYSGVGVGIKHANADPETLVDNLKEKFHHERIELGEDWGQFAIIKISTGRDLTEAEIMRIDEYLHEYSPWQIEVYNHYDTQTWNTTLRTTELQIVKQNANESVEFQRGGDRSIHQKMNVGIDHKVKTFLEKMAKDYQFNPNAPEDDYLGFINIGEDLIVKPEDLDTFRYYVDHWKEYDVFLFDLGLKNEHIPDYEETIFLQTKRHPWHPDNPAKKWYPNGA